MAKPKTHTEELKIRVSPELLAAPVFNEQATKEELLWFIDSNRDPRPCTL